MTPSYADLSSIDGSAFVTKTEFDSALANFNSRLATFEADINSKIDSQVTSYLDRNGIWNGKDQQINFDTWPQYQSVLLTSFTSDNTRNRSETVNNILAKWEFKCNKSGLLYFQGKEICPAKDDASWGPFIRWSSGGIGSHSSGDFHLQCWSSGDIISTLAIRGMTMVNDSNVQLVFVDGAKALLICFVRKDQNITVGYEFATERISGYPWTLVGGWDYTKGGGSLSFGVQLCKVY